MTGMNFKQRNASIYRDREKGMSYGEIARKHDISAGRVEQIYKQMRRRVEFRQNDELYSIIADAASFIQMDEKNAMRLYNVLRRNGITTVDELAGMSLQELFGWRNVGHALVALCAIAMEKAAVRELRGDA